jgi:transposase
MKKGTSNEVTVSWKVAVGVDLGDRYSRYCVMARHEEMVLEEDRIATTPEALRKRFAGVEPMRIAIEVGTHSPWVDRLLRELGHEVIVSHVAAIGPRHKTRRKNDRRDARQLAALVRTSPSLLSPIRHRSAETQADRALLRARDGLVRARTQLINTVRSCVKSLGSRLPSSSAEAFPHKVADAVPEALGAALVPVLGIIEQLTVSIRDYDRQIERLARDRYPQTQLLQQITGVGALTALAFVLTLESPERFARSRAVGPYLGLVPGQDASGQRDPECRISKSGDALCRRLLVSSAQYILGPFGPDCDLRRFGERLAGRGAKNAKKRAVVAVARKLAVLMHRLWSRGEVYEPCWSQRSAAA